ncbi:MAG: GreA/GreB family elongation factor [Parafilimonas sp.]
MKTSNNNLVIALEDFETLNNYLKPIVSFDRENATLLLKEINKATIVKKDELPLDIVRLNSRVTIKEEKRHKVIELVLVVPEKANIHEKMVSVFAPIGVALIGFKQGEKVNCDAPSGNKIYTIMKVCNNYAT